MVARRRLERAVLQALWGSPEDLTAHQVVDLVGSPTPAITTVLTALERLRGKGLVTRTRQGRAFAYRAAAAREQLVASAMLAALEDSGNRALALSRFVDEVPADDVVALRKALEQRDDRGSPGPD